MILSRLYRAKTRSRSSCSFATAGASSEVVATSPPRELQLENPELFDVCQIYQRAALEPSAKTSTRPSCCCAATGWPVTLPPSFAHCGKLQRHWPKGSELVQQIGSEVGASKPPLALTCQVCQR